MLIFAVTCCISVRDVKASDTESLGFGTSESMRIWEALKRPKIRERDLQERAYRS